MDGYRLFRRDFSLLRMQIQTVSWETALKTMGSKKIGHISKKKSSRHRGYSYLLKDELAEKMTSLNGKGAFEGSQGKKEDMSHLGKGAGKSGSV